MATAKSIVDAGGDQKRVACLSIKDDASTVWRFDRTERKVDPSEKVQVRYEHTGNAGIRPALVLGDDGTPILRQDAPGLPPSIIVSFDDPIMPGIGGTFVAGAYWAGAELAEFVQAKLVR